MGEASDAAAADAGAAVADLAVRPAGQRQSGFGDAVGGSRVGDAVDRDIIQEHVLARVVGALAAEELEALARRDVGGLGLGGGGHGWLLGHLLSSCAALRGLGRYLYVGARSSFDRYLPK